jgi:hypothetical protein
MINEHMIAAVTAPHSQWKATGQVHGGQAGCSYNNILDCKPHKSNRIEGVVGLLWWIEKVKSSFTMCNCLATSPMRFTSGTLEGTALTWWNSQVQILGLGPANAMAWDEFKNLLKDRIVHEIRSKS